MDGSAYLLPVIFMAAIAAAAGIAAIVVAFRGLGPQRFSRAEMRALRFQFPDEMREAPDPADTAAAAAIASRPGRPPPPPARLELSLVSPDSPSRLRIPVSMTAGRILELGLPLLLSTRGGRDLEDVRLRITLPTEITFGASLDRMTGSALGLPGARASYSSGEGDTVIDIALPRTPGGAEVEIPIPVCIKGSPTGAHTLAIAAAGGGLEPIRREYRLELETKADAGALVDAGEGVAWICRPDEGQRQSDPALPLDRIARFRIDDLVPRQAAIEAPAPVTAAEI